MKRASADGEQIETALNKFLLQYRNSAHSSTQKEPAVAMFGRRLRTRLDQLRAPSAAECVASAQRAQLVHAGGTPRDFAAGDSVLVRNFSKQGTKWNEGTVMERTGSVTYKVVTEGNRTSTKHTDQLMPNRSKRYSWALGAGNDSVDRGLDNAPPADTTSSPVPSSPASANDMARDSAAAHTSPLAPAHGSPPQARDPPQGTQTPSRPTLRPRKTKPNYKF